MLASWSLDPARSGVVRVKKELGLKMLSFTLERYHSHRHWILVPFTFYSFFPTQYLIAFCFSFTYPAHTQYCHSAYPFVLRRSRERISESTTDSSRCIFRFRSRVQNFSSQSLDKLSDTSHVYGQHTYHILPQSIRSTFLRYCRVHLQNKRAVASPSRLIATGGIVNIEYQIISAPPTTYSLGRENQPRPFLSPRTSIIVD